MTRAFTIRPFNKKKDSAGKEIDFERIDRELIQPALEAAGLVGGTTGQIVEAGNIREDMFALIIEADLVVCDFTIHNANVFYELGIRHALRKKRSVLIKGVPAADSPPFDLLTDRYVTYNIDDPGRSVEALTEAIRATLASERETDSPIFKMLPTLREVDPTTVAQVVPMDLIEEVGRAVAAKAAGWLRLLVFEVTGLRFEWPALRLIGQAQWEIGDYDGARRSWEQVVGTDPNDIAANLALANLYERQYRKERRPEQFTASEQAIARVLSRGSQLTAAQRAEALALEGRNQKTVWRLSFEGLADLSARRSKAASRALRASYDAYRKAYLEDLNHFWPGLAALQLGVISLDLARDADSWSASFDTDEQAKSYVADLTRQVGELRTLIPLAAAAALARLPRGHKDRVWAEMSFADVSFLVEPNPNRVVRAYADAVPKSNLFAWDAARGQLELFASLGAKEELARDIISAIESDLKRVVSPEAHVIVFAGHQVDAPDRPEPRFPPGREMKARALISEQLQGLKSAGLEIELLASAAPGSDIICHEVCGELHVRSTLCLPMPRDAYASEVFGSFDRWRSRYLGLLDTLPVLELSDRIGLPRWLSATPGVEPWERGNRWVLEMARARGARRATLLALWSGREEPDLPGGTGHMVRIARQSGMVDVVVIDADQLLAD